MSSATIMALGLTLCVAGGCARPLLGPDGADQGDSAGSSSSEGTTGVVAESSAESSGESGTGPSACHSSYSPCLPVVDDLNCSDVRAMGKAPVIVSGPDDYDLDADGDGIGCED